VSRPARARTLKAASVPLPLLEPQAPGQLSMLETEEIPDYACWAAPAVITDDDVSRAQEWAQERADHAGEL
jgi:hypothetical protein